VVDSKSLIANGGVSRHETFTPRYGWLTKGYTAATEDHRIFNAPDAIETLGVGKNMVQSIRSWCLAFHLLKRNEDKSDKSNFGELIPTELGHRLLHKKGWDTYLEDIASLWLLHWQLFVPPFEAVSWPLAFNHCTLPTFDSRHLSMSLILAAQQYGKLASVFQSSFQKDASCIIRMYNNGKSETGAETTSPFSQLSIIRASEEPGEFRFVIAEKATLPPLVFTACCFAYAALTQPNQRTLSLHKLVYELNSPGIAFKLSETEAGRLIDVAAHQLKEFEFVELVGNRQVQFEKKPDQLYWQALEAYYKDGHS
jgi:hypothetical protein